jgi:K+-sensing histidine kinase KdpD
VYRNSLLHKLVAVQEKGGREMSAMATIDEFERAELPTSDSWLSISILHDLRNPLATIYAAAEMLVDLDPERLK